ncbi:hypothetical protein [Nonomuraea sp. NPDC049625]|uniref:hypothetical protein n=1 Tax=Nonomuraea sp. NPDC049625 TaxID=3155775 RepID=UPI003414E2EB
MTQVIPSPAWQELRDLVAEGRTADLADRVIPMLPGPWGRGWRRSSAVRPRLRRREW